MNNNHEKAIGEAWFDGVYTQEQAERTTGLQGLSWEKVLNEYAFQYEKSEKLSANQWN